MFSASDGGAEIEEVTRVQERERQVRKLFITPSFRANLRVLRRLGAETRRRSSLSRVIFHGAIDDKRDPRFR